MNEKKAPLCGSVNMEWFSILKLNKENVISALRECAATPDTPKEWVWSGHIFSEESKRTAPTIRLDNFKLDVKIPIFKYWVGQLLVVHKQKSSFTMGQGSIDYTGKKWTEDNNVVAALYYLAVSSLTLPHFHDGEQYAEISDMDKWYKHLPPHVCAGGSEV